MKKILAIMLVAVFAATGAYADERLQLSGQMRVQGLNLDNYGVAAKVATGTAAIAPFDDTSKGDEMSYWRQRFRVAAKINVAEGVSGNLRFDFGESEWGGTGYAGPRWTDAAELQVDRAYLDVQKEMFGIKAGQQYVGLGNSIVYDGNVTGFNLALKLPVTVNLIYAKIDENGLTDEDSLNSEDKDHYAINLGYKTDTFTINAFYAMQKDDTQAVNAVAYAAAVAGPPYVPAVTGAKAVKGEFDAHVFGFQGTAAFGPINLNAELDIFGGDYYANATAQAAGTKTDLMGTQFTLDANMALGAGKVGAYFLYAAGTDDANETQITNLTDFGSWAPMSYGILEFTDWDPIQDGVGNDVYDFTGDSAGVIAFAPYGEFKPMDALAIRGQIGYMVPQDDDQTKKAGNSDIDSVWLINLGVQYDFAPNTAIFLSYNRTQVEFHTAGTNDDPAQGLFSELRVNF